MSSWPQQQGLIGGDLLEWQDENVESPVPLNPSRKTTKKKEGTNAEEEPKPKRSKAQATQQEPVNSASKKLPHVTPAGPLSSPFFTSGLATATSRPIPRVRHALAVDTRALDTEEGMLIFQNVREQVLTFLAMLSRRGAAPCILGCSTQQESVRKSKSPRGGSARGVMQATAMHTIEILAALEKGDDSSLLQPVLIQPPSNSTNVQNRKAVLVPKRLLAHDSWMLFGDLGTSCSTLHCRHRSFAAVLTRHL